MAEGKQPVRDAALQRGHQPPDEGWGVPTLSWGLVFGSIVLALASTAIVLALESQRGATAHVALPEPLGRTGVGYEAATLKRNGLDRLQRWEWVDRDKRVARIPIEQAMTILAGRAAQRTGAAPPGPGPAERAEEHQPAPEGKRERLEAIPRHREPGQVERTGGERGAERAHEEHESRRSEEVPPRQPGGEADEAANRAGAETGAGAHDDLPPPMPIRRVSPVEPGEDAGQPGARARSEEDTNGEKRAGQQGRFSDTPNGVNPAHPSRDSAERLAVHPAVECAATEHVDASPIAPSDACFPIPQPATKLTENQP